jgi:adenylate cyclase
MAERNSKAARLWEELKHRKVVRVAIAYVVIGWALIQVADATLKPLHLPDWAGTLVVWLVALGFPIAIVLAWMLDVTPRGIVLAESTGAPPGRPAEPDGNSIAVLPFLNISGDADNEYFSDGLSEELLNLLARMRALRVCSRTTAFALKGKDLDMPAIAGKLGVRHVLEGSVRRAGDRVRITAQLIDAVKDHHLWSETYDRDLQDIFAVQEEIAGQIVNALKLKLSGDERLAIRSTTNNVDALDCYLLGREYYHRSEPGHLDKSREQFERAIAIDPDYALAWAWLTYVFVDYYWYQGREPGWLARAHEASIKAVELAPNLAESHGARAYALRADEQCAAAEAEFEKAIDINPRLFEPIHHYAQMARSMGQFQRAADLFERAAAVRPEDYQALALAMNMYEALGDDDAAHRAASESLARARRAVELNPGDSRALCLGAGSLLRLGNVDGALDWMERARATNPRSNGVAYNAACLYAKLGFKEKALDLAEEAFKLGSRNKLYWETDPDFESIRDHPRFQAILKRL